MLRRIVGDHGASMLLSISESQHGFCLSQTLRCFLAFGGKSGVDDLLHLQTITSPAEETMIDSVRDMAIEQLFIECLFLLVL